MKPGFMLSPSRALTFTRCPKQFYYQVIEKRPDPPSPAIILGLRTHTVLERLFDRPRSERTLDTALQLAETVSSDAGELKKIGGFLRNYFVLEDPRRFDPGRTEWRIKHKVGRVPVTGVIDRFDKTRRGVFITDYKTGNPRYAGTQFFGMQFYGMLVSALGTAKNGWLRILLLKDATKTSQHFDSVTVEQTRRKIVDIWDGMEQAWEADEWPARTSNLCNYCNFKSICPAFNPPQRG